MLRDPGSQESVYGLYLLTNETWKEIAETQSWHCWYGMKSIAAMRVHSLLSSEVGQLARSSFLALISI